MEVDLGQSKAKDRDLQNKFTYRLGLADQTLKDYWQKLKKEKRENSEDGVKFMQEVASVVRGNFKTAYNK